MSFAVIIPTRNAGTDWQLAVSALNAQTVQPDRVLVVDSQSTDNTVDIARSAGFAVETVAVDTFDHGGTRMRAVERCREYDFVVFLTQDAILASPGSLARILAPFDDPVVSAVCGRQLPRKQAAPLEAHARLYNYGGESSTRTLADRDRYGLKTAFISNSFAAYRTEKLLEVGNFPENVIFGEDMFVATKMLLAGYAIAYAADAAVYHSHGYTAGEEMKRYFDMGVFHARQPWIRQALGSAEGEGIKFVRSELRYMAAHGRWRIGGVLLRNLLRYGGFKLGLVEAGLPLCLKRRLAMNRRYFLRTES